MLIQSSCNRNCSHPLVSSLLKLIILQPQQLQRLLPQLPRSNLLKPIASRASRRVTPPRRPLRRLRRRSLSRRILRHSLNRLGLPTILHSVIVLLLLLGQVTLPRETLVLLAGESIASAGLVSVLRLVDGELLGGVVALDVVVDRDAVLLLGGGALNGEFALGAVDKVAAGDAVPGVCIRAVGAVSADDTGVLISPRLELLGVVVPVHGESSGGVVGALLTGGLPLDDDLVGLRLVDGDAALGVVWEAVLAGDLLGGGVAGGGVGGVVEGRGLEGADDGAGAGVGEEGAVEDRGGGGGGREGEGDESDGNLHCDGDMKGGRCDVM